MLIAPKRKISQIRQGFTAARVVQLSVQGISAQHLGYFHIDEVRHVQDPAPSEQAFLDGFCSRGAQEHFEQGRCVNDSHSSSATIAFQPDRHSWIKCRCHGGALFQPRPQFLDGRPFSNIADFVEQVVRQGHSGQRSARFEAAMQGFGNVADLDHGRHGNMLSTCDPHVNMLKPCESTAGATARWRRGWSARRSCPSPVARAARVGLCARRDRASPP